MSVPTGSNTFYPFIGPVTSAAATPFEVLRVKSMIRLDAVGWTDVLRTFLVSLRM
jgi:hypothetical protein